MVCHGLQPGTPAIGSKLITTTKNSINDTFALPPIVRQPMRVELPEDEIVEVRPLQDNEEATRPDAS
jgi:hypothetical protein